MAQQASPHPSVRMLAPPLTAGSTGGWSPAAVERWARDPGALRLTQGLKTVLAILLVLALLCRIAPNALVSGALGTGVLMQCAEGTTRRQRMGTMFVSGLILILLAFVGAILDGHHEIKEVLLVVVAFLTFYVRRYVPGKPGFTNYGFVIFLLASMLPGGLEQAATNAAVLAAALAVAFPVFFVIRPPDVLGAFAEAVRARCAGMVVLLRLPHSGEPSAAAEKTQQAIVRLGALARALVDAAPPGPARDRAEELQSEQIDVRQMVQMLLDSLVQLNAAADRPAEVVPLLNALLATFAAGFTDIAGGGSAAFDSTTARETLEQWALQPATPLGPALTHVGGVLLVAHRLPDAICRIGQLLEDLSREKGS